MSYSHLSITERICLYDLLLKKTYSMREIAKALCRNVSTIIREIKRNSIVMGNGKGYPKYFPTTAQKKYDTRRLKSHRPCEHTCENTQYVEEKIEEHWSPEQIANRVTEKNEKVPSTATIYRMIHSGKIGTVKKVRMNQLRRKGQYKRPKCLQGRFDDKGRTIKNRPKEIYKRKELGHWEGDAIVSGMLNNAPKSTASLISIVERKSRYCIVVKVKDKKAETVAEAIINAMKDLPLELRKSITFDRGKEFSKFEDIEKALNCKTYFCDPYCAWQKGTNENTNGLLREFYPKGSDLSLVCENQLKEIQELMNNRPRKCINYKTAREVLFE